jgi:Mannosyltransferase (PIG-V)
MAKLAKLADAAAVAFGLLGLYVYVFGELVLYLGPLPVIRAHGAGRLFFVALALIAIRHVLMSSDPLHRRLMRGIRVPGDSALGVARFALATRIGVLVVAYFAVITIGLAPDPGFMVSADPVGNLPARYDAGWYGEIALEGYSFQGRFDRQQTLAFFPAFPMLARIVGYPLGAFAPGVPRDRRLARVLWAAVLISMAAFAWGAVYLWRLARDTIGEARAFDAVALAVAYPFALFFSAAYSESLFLLGAVAAIYHFRRDEFLAAAAWGLLVGLTRPNGCFLSVVLALFVLDAAIAKSRNRQVPQSPNPQITKSLLSAAAPGVGMLIYSAYVKHVTGAWFGWARLHETWGRSYEGLAPLQRAMTWISGEGLLHVIQNIPFDSLNAIGLIFALVMCWAVFRRLGLAYAVFILINLVPPMLAGGVLSMGRLTATLFPMFLALAAVLPPRAVTPVVTLFALGQGFATVLFFTWRPLF